MQPQKNMAEIGTEGTGAEEGAVAAVIVLTVQTPGPVPAVVVAMEVEIRKNS